MGFQAIKIERALDRISQNEYVLPSIQREFVWSADQICKLFDSVTLGYPIGTFLFWRAPRDLSRSFRFYGFMRDYHELKWRHSPTVSIAQQRDVTAILDGQQRLTALNIGLLGSLAVRKKYGRAGNPAAYPKRQLHLDLAHEPGGDDDDRTYRFEFLSDAEASGSTGGSVWFRVGEILDLAEGAGIFRRVQQLGLAEHPNAFETLDRLWRAIHVHEVISFFEEDSDSIDRVLRIFIRTNSGGTVLSKSDLLLSIATAQFSQLDARTAVHDLVDDLNATGQGFAFTKDNALKAGLMITDRPSIQFRVEAFTKEHVDVLEKRWDDVDLALRVAAQLLASFGLSARTMSATSVLLPLADYVAHRRLGYEYVTSHTHRADREKCRRWVTRALLKQGIWGAGLDTLLTRLRKAIRASGGDCFPVEALEHEMTQMGKSPTLTGEEIEDLVEVPISSRRAFPLLALLYPGVDVRNEFHMDHVFPRSLFTAHKLSRSGVDRDHHEEYQDLRDRLPNLQLLEGGVNVSKQASLPAAWARQFLPDDQARNGWLAAHDLTALPDGLPGFPDFYARRRALMLERFRSLLGVTSSTQPPAADPHVPAPANPVTPAPTPHGKRTPRSPLPDHNGAVPTAPL